MFIDSLYIFSYCMIKIFEYQRHVNKEKLISASHTKCRPHRWALQVQVFQVLRAEDVPVRLQGAASLHHEGVPRQGVSADQAHRGVGGLGGSLQQPRQCAGEIGPHGGVLWLQICCLQGNTLGTSDRVFWFGSHSLYLVHCTLYLVQSSS